MDEHLRPNRSEAPAELPPQQPDASQPPPESHERAQSYEVGMRSLAPMRGRNENTVLGNRDAVLNDARTRVVGILTNSGYMKADRSARTMALTLLEEEFARMPEDLQHDAEAAARYVADAIKRTSTTIADTAKEFDAYRGAEASLGLIHLLEDSDTGEPTHAIIAMIGGGRVYRYRTRGLEQLTEDQTDAGGAPSGAIGREGGRPATVLDEDAQPGDVLLILSEDILKGLGEADILRACNAEAGDPTRVSDALTRAARQQGMPGSLTAVAVRIPEADVRA